MLYLNGRYKVRSYHEKSGKLTEIQNIVFELIQLLVTAANIFFICMFTFFNYDVDPLLSNLPQA